VTWEEVRPPGFEPGTCGLRVRCSAIELEARTEIVGDGAWVTEPRTDGPEEPLGGAQNTPGAIRAQWMCPTRSSKLP
jgi:hypothetical protein